MCKPRARKELFSNNYKSFAHKDLQRNNVTTYQRVAKKQHKRRLSRWQKTTRLQRPTHRPDVHGDLFGMTNNVSHAYHVPIRSDTRNQTRCMVTKPMHLFVIQQTNIKKPPPGLVEGRGYPLKSCTKSSSLHNEITFLTFTRMTRDSEGIDSTLWPVGLLLVREFVRKGHEWPHVT